MFPEVQPLQDPPPLGANSDLRARQLERDPGPEADPEHRPGGRMTAGGLEKCKPERLHEGQSALEGEGVIDKDKEQDPEMESKRD